MSGFKLSPVAGLYQLPWPLPGVVLLGLHSNPGPGDWLPGMLPGKGTDGVGPDGSGFGPTDGNVGGTTGRIPGGIIVPPGCSPPGPVLPTPGGSVVPPG